MLGIVIAAGFFAQLALGAATVHTFRYGAGNGAFFNARSGKTYNDAYSGFGKAYSNRICESNVKDLGPIPLGLWKVTGVTQSKGPRTLVLEPLPFTNTYDRERNTFRVHGDNKKGDRSASEGCIIVGPECREDIHIGDYIAVRPDGKQTDYYTGTQTSCTAPSCSNVMACTNKWQIDADIGKKVEDLQSNRLKLVDL